MCIRDSCYAVFRTLPEVCGLIVQALIALGGDIPAEIALLSLIHILYGGSLYDLAAEEGLEARIFDKFVDQILVVLLADQMCIRDRNAYYDKENWKNLVHHCMECDFSWDVSAKSYEGLYNETANLW